MNNHRLFKTNDLADVDQPDLVLSFIEKYRDTSIYLSIAVENLTKSEEMSIDDARKALHEYVNFIINYKKDYKMTRNCEKFLRAFQSAMRKRGGTDGATSE